MKSFIRFSKASGSTRRRVENFFKRGRRVKVSVWSLFKFLFAGVESKPTSPKLLCPDCCLEVFDRKAYYNLVYNFRGHAICQRCGGAFSVRIDPPTDGEGEAK
jgi:hypothetical protein